MKILCLSDTHGHLPQVPDCDLLLLAGDYNLTHRRRQGEWFTRFFAPWVRSLSERMPVVGVAGNHDWFFYNGGRLDCGWTYLQDSGVEVGGLKIWGSPWQPEFYDWAFNATESELAARWEMIPDDTDILLLHGPPFGYGDLSPFGNVHCGSKSLLRRIEEVQPRLAVAGHIHSGRGRYKIGDTLFINASHVDEGYRPRNNPLEVTLDCPALESV